MLFDHSCSNLSDAVDCDNLEWVLSSENPNFLCDFCKKWKKSF